MKYAGIIKNDTSAAPGICVTFFVQGCPFHCIGCHNSQAWDFNGGREFTENTLNEILEAISANGIKRNFCVMGGEPLCYENVELTKLVIEKVKEKYPEILIYVWTGNEYEVLKEREDESTKYILNTIDCLIDGRFILEKRDITLEMRGSSNQRIIYLNRCADGNQN